MPEIDFPDQEKERYIDPDRIYGSGVTSVTFICGEVFGEYEFLFSQDRYNTHARIVANHAIDTGHSTKEDLFYDDDFKQLVWDLRKEVSETALLGRVGSYRQREYISYWNHAKELYNKYLLKSLEELIDEGLIDRDDIRGMWISTPYGTGPYDEFVKYGVEKAPDLTPEEKKRYAMQQRMHLARGEEKKAIRKALGLWTDKPAEPGVYGKMYQRRFDPEVAKWWTPECNLNFKEWMP